MAAQVGRGQGQAGDLQQDVCPAADDDKNGIERDAAQVVARRRPMRWGRDDQHHLLARRSGLGLDMNCHRSLVQPGLGNCLGKAAGVDKRAALLQGYGQVAYVDALARYRRLDIDVSLQVRLAAAVGLPADLHATRIRRSRRRLS